MDLQRLYSITRANFRIHKRCSQIQKNTASDKATYKYIITDPAGLINKTHYKIVNKNSVNPWKWQDNFSFSQATEVTGVHTPYSVPDKRQLTKKESPL